MSSSSRRRRGEETPDSPPETPQDPPSEADAPTQELPAEPPAAEGPQHDAAEGPQDAGEGDAEFNGTDAVYTAQEGAGPCRMCSSPIEEGQQYVILTNGRKAHYGDCSDQARAAGYLGQIEA